jgi:hypothetical protein
MAFSESSPGVIASTLKSLSAEPWTGMSGFRLIAALTMALGYRLPTEPLLHDSNPGSTPVTISVTCSTGMASSAA